MHILSTGTIFPPALLARLPLNYRFMVCVASVDFKEHYTQRRFGRSARHQARQYLCALPGKPVSSLVMRDYLMPAPPPGS